MSKFPVGSRVRTVQWGGSTSSHYAGQEGTVVEDRDLDPRYVGVALDSEIGKKEQPLPCTDDELELIEA